MFKSSNNAFERDNRRQQELKMRPIADSIYRDWVWKSRGEDVEITRNEDFLDQHLAIDVVLRFANGLALTGQEKFLSFEYAKYNSLTIEYEQNQHTGERGDWFNMAAQFYFCGYCDQYYTDFVTVGIVAWSAVVAATLNNVIQWQTNRNKNGHARASFRYVNFSHIPWDCYLYSKNIRLSELTS